MHYDARKHLLEFDDVANDQRKVIYQLRDRINGHRGCKGSIHCHKRGRN